MLNESRRWLFVGGFSLQPSELAKLAAVLFLAYQLDRKWQQVNQPALLIPVGLTLAGMSVLILLEPDFGTAGLLLLVGGLLLFLGGLAWRFIALAALFALPAAWVMVLSVPYRRARVVAFLDPDLDPLGKGFQVQQSLIAVGSGGLLGRGMGEGVQKLHFLPFANSDFIYAIVGEELGLVGAVGVLLLFVVLGWRGVVAGARAPDVFGRFLAWGMTAMVVIQALIHISISIQLLPTTGIPLPLVSSGGCSMVATLAACGVILNVSQHA
jgi:cell division protein FtsW